MKTKGRTMSMHADEESDEVVLPVKRSNNEGLSSAEISQGDGQTAAARHCAGIPRRTGWQPCAERRDRARLYGSRRCYITSPPIS
jgi:hypothetical protein